MIQRNNTNGLMRMSIISLIISLVIPGISQFNDRSSNVTLLGMGMKYTDHYGFLGYVSFSSDSNDPDGDRPRFYDESARGLSMDFRHVNFARDCVISVSGESALYTLGELFSPRTELYKGSFNFLVGQPTEYLSHNNYQEMKEYHTRWINIRYIEANATFGPWDLQFGLHTSIRSLGYTDFKSFSREFSKIVATGDLVTKLLAGPAIGYRKTIDNVNVLAVASIGGSLNMKHSYKLKNSKHVEISAFLGKRAGIFASAYLRTFDCEAYSFDGKIIAPNFVEYAIHGGLFYCTSQK